MLLVVAVAAMDNGTKLIVRRVTTAWFGAAQFPVYLAPIALGWIAKWRRARAARSAHDHDRDER